jgi:hypothetical protein
MSAYNNNGKAALLKNDMDSVTLKAIFFDPDYTPDIDADVYLSDVSASRTTGSTDQTLTNVTITVDNTNNRVKVDADDISLTNQTWTDGSDKVGIYISTGTDSTSEMICTIDITEGLMRPLDGPVTLTWSANGIFAI